MWEETRSSQCTYIRWRLCSFDLIEENLSLQPSIRKFERAANRKAASMVWEVAWSQHRRFFLQTLFSSLSLSTPKLQKVVYRSKQWADRWSGMASFNNLAALEQQSRALTSREFVERRCVYTTNNRRCHPGRPCHCEETPLGWSAFHRAKWR